MRKLIFLALVIVQTFLPGYGSVGKPVPAAGCPDVYLPLLRNKKIAVVANQTSMTGEKHLVDFLLDNKIDIVRIFAPEHGFRGSSDAGDTIANGRDRGSGLPVVSIYGEKKKPDPEDMKGIDIVVFDIQDVGVRFYTYLSTLHYVMEACAENNVMCIVLDRPNPNGFYYDGPVLDTAFRSFVGMHPVPVVTGMTIGEYALMINGEGWLKGKIKCDLKVIKCKNYTHYSYYELPVKPSPNLPNMTSVYLYPSVCFFEGTRLSLGRGTDFPFQVYGSPLLPDRGFSFTPESMPGALKPPLQGVKCYGRDLRNALIKGIVPASTLNLEWIIEAYRDFPEKNKFFTSYFDTLAGGPVLREQIQKGMSAEQISGSWKKDLAEFAKIRKKYLIYK
jgi:uncharacterized protein YbbC (DUF1343 family)